MNKSAIKNFATGARRKLISDITQKAYEIGITPKEIQEVDVFQGGFRVNGRLFKEYELKQRQELVKHIRDRGFDQVVEEVAYTWFNRFIALRFMEVNEYLPTGVRVLSSLDPNRAEPDIIGEALNLDLDLDQDLVYQYQDNNDTEGLFKYLLIKQCNQLANIMPGIFEQISHYTELLLPNHLLVEGSVIKDLVESIEEDDFKEQVEIIGWLYQYYIAEKKDEVFAGLKKNIKITKENIPAATQLFTPEWIVKYMVENSLGRLWLESHPDAELQAKWKYYLEEAEQEPEVQKQLEELRNKDLSPEDIKVLDPAMGSGHILVYAFDVLYDIYLSAGYSERDIPRLILEKNLYGLDICDRAGQLAYFALMMRARGKNRRIFRNRLELNVCSIQESNGIPKEAVEFFADGDEGLKKDFQYLIDVFRDAKEYGSILDVQPLDFDALERRLKEIQEQGAGDLFSSAYKRVVLEKAPALIKQAKVMSGKYDVVCTNPPYMGYRGMNAKLSLYVKDKFPNTKNDLFAVFMELDQSKLKNNRLLAMINQHSWMFLSRFEELRKKIIKNSEILSLIHLGPHAFQEIGGEVVQTAAFVIRRCSHKRYFGKYIRLVEQNNARNKEIVFLKAKNAGSNCYITTMKNFATIPGVPIAYWASDKFFEIFKKGQPLGHFAEVKRGMTTSNNNKFLRFWPEVSITKVCKNAKNSTEAEESRAKWFPYSKGGGYRKWYGFLEYLVNWENSGHEVIEFAKTINKSYTRTIVNISYYFKPSVGFSYITTGPFSMRWIPEGCIYDSGGPGVFADEDKRLFILGCLNSKPGISILKLLNPTINLQIADVVRLPLFNYERIYKDQSYNDKIRQMIKLSKYDWDSFETSWDFLKHPFITFKSRTNTIKDIFSRWYDFTDKQFYQLKRNEEELNSIFIDIYGLRDELTPEVEDKDITISKANRERDIKSFISYAVGCMFGRYSLDEEGLIYAGGEFDPSRYKIYMADEDNIIPILDDAYFDEGEDIVSRFVEFVKITFGAETLEENLEYIAETLKKRTGETSRQAIRRYFLNDFYKDHVQTYKKRPIYWLFDSGRQNGFKALIYMHRYDPFTVARVRTDYLHKLQKRYEAESERLETVIQSDASQAEKNKARKKKEAIAKQMKECMVYDQLIAYVANQKIAIDLDDGVVVNYAKFQGVEIPQCEGKKPLKADLLARI